ncbi:MAG: hypothetical protein IJ410_03410 [Oscillospiraceae bacterium]|nr:hypothetical protein [Oscillospiraceae bacterium]
MNAKIQAEIVKAPIGWSYDYDQVEEEVYFSDGVMVKRMSVRECMIDLSRLEQVDLIKYFQDDFSWPPVEPTKLRLKEVGYTAICLEGEKHKCWIKESYYKMFRKYIFEYSGGNWVQVRHPETIEIIAVIAVIKTNRE